MACDSACLRVSLPSVILEEDVPACCLLPEALLVEDPVMSVRLLDTFRGDIVSLIALDL